MTGRRFAIVSFTTIGLLIAFLFSAYLSEAKRAKTIAHMQVIMATWSKATVRPSLMNDGWDHNFYYGGFEGKRVLMSLGKNGRYDSLEYPGDDIVVIDDRFVAMGKPKASDSSILSNEAFQRFCSKLVTENKIFTPNSRGC